MEKNNQIQSEERQVLMERALELRLRGFTYREIAQKLDISRMSAHNYVQAELRACAARRQDMATELIEQQVQRLERDLRNLDRAIELVGQTIHINHELHMKLADTDEYLVSEYRPCPKLLKEWRELIEQRRKHSESMRKLLGLDAPTKVAQTDTKGEDIYLSTNDRRTRLQELARRREERQARMRTDTHNTPPEDTSHTAYEGEA